MTRVVIDASTLLSASVARPDSPPSLLLDAIRAGTIEMVACDQLLGEVEAGLKTRYFRDRIGDEEGRAIIAMLRALAVMLPDPESPPRVVRDPSDDYLVALALGCEADAIVTGDRDLLDHEGLAPQAVTARDACERFRLIDA